MKSPAENFKKDKSLVLLLEQGRPWSGSRPAEIRAGEAAHARHLFRPSFGWITAWREASDRALTDSLQSNTQVLLCVFGRSCLPALTMFLKGT
jgi:hypothetical protein